MNQTLNVRNFWRFFTGSAVLILSVTLLVLPNTAWGEALTVEQEKVRITAEGSFPDSVGPPDRVRVLVYVQPGVKRGPIHAFAKGNGGVVKYEYKTIMPNVMNLRNIPDTTIEALKKIPGVVRVVEDKYHKNLIKLDESTPLVNGLQSQISNSGHSADGEGVRVCVCDTGIDTDHIMYSDRIDFEASRDFYNGDADPEDDNGHGSHVAGIAVGGTGLSVDFGCEGSEPFQGVAPKATLIGVKILNSQGGGFDSDIIAGIDHCADQSAAGGRADVINLSIGTGQFSGPCDHSWAVAANNAVATGVVVVAASGNENFTNALSSPACGSDVIAVGATYKDNYPNCEDSTSEFNWSNCTDYNPAVDDIACFSNVSDYLDVAAPGAVIWSASTASGGASITGKSGTSMAAPHVAGLAALILSAKPNLTPYEVRQIIRDGAIDKGAVGFDRTYGHGRIDVISSLSHIGPCIVNADCDDGLYCNGEETCVDGACLEGTPIACSDDGLFCNGSEICDESLETCSHTGDPCDPGLECNEDTDQCDSLCGNGECNEGENCNSCPSDCDSGLGGTPEACWKYDGVCHPVKEDETCADCSPGFCCGNGVCEDGEDGNNCEIDCGAPPFCGDGECIDGEDKCSCSGDCGTPPSFEDSCSNGLDDDCDGFADCSDTDCDADPYCSGPDCNTIDDRKLCNNESRCRWDNRNKVCLGN